MAGFFSTNYRLTANTQFQQVLKHGKKCILQHVVVMFIPNKKQHARLGIIVAKKRASKAKDRNRFKRLVREVFRSSPAKALTFDIVVIARSSFTRATNQEIIVCLKDSLRFVTKAVAL